MITIVGVHEIDAAEPCFLLEVSFDKVPEGNYWDEVTQEIPNQPRSNWQVPYDERPLNDSETSWAFFFHYLDLKKPLLTPDGSIVLPSPSPRPEYLQGVKYEEP
ncbi:MAG: hypothetical protein CL608_13140 [Anaerolineaceae bacterium]|nr:hypothetical protein [Anaerolineaceae bacterium]